MARTCLLVARFMLPRNVPRLRLEGPRLRTSLVLRHATALVSTLVICACGSGMPPMSPTPVPTPTGDPVTANVYILPGAVTLGANAFGDEAIVIVKGERMRWRNLDSVEHTLVPDTPSLPEFQTTGAGTGRRAIVRHDDDRDHEDPLHGTSANGRHPGGARTLTMCFHNQDHGVMAVLLHTEFDDV